MKTLPFVLGLVLVGLVGCGPSRATKERAVYDAAEAVLACYGKLDMPLPDFTLPEDRHAALNKEFLAEVTRRRNEQQAHAVERLAAAKSLYPAESDTARELARIRVMLGSDWNSCGPELEVAASVLREQFRSGK